MLYTLDQLPNVRVTLTATVVAAVKAAAVKKSSFKKAFPTFSKSKETKGRVDVLRSDVEDNEGMVFMRLGKQGVILFSRQGLSNMAETPIELSDGISASCIEELFQLLKPFFFKGMEGSNAEEIMIAILNAPKPRFAKSAGNNTKPFEPEVWNAQRKSVMYACILAALENESTYNRYLSFVPKLVEELGEIDELYIVEANSDDTFWANNRFAGETADRIEQLLEAEADLDLIGATKRVNKESNAMGKSGGENVLGEILTDLLTTFRYKTHAEFMEHMRPAKRVKTCHGEGRSLTCPW